MTLTQVYMCVHVHYINCPYGQCVVTLSRAYTGRGTALPAKPHEERVVSLCAELDAAQNAHGRVDVDVLAEVDDVQIFDGDPAKDRSRDRTRATSSIRTFQLILVSFLNVTCSYRKYRAMCVLVLTAYVPGFHEVGGAVHGQQ